MSEFSSTFETVQYILVGIDCGVYNKTCQEILISVWWSSNWTFLVFFKNSLSLKNWYIACGSHKILQLSHETFFSMLYVIEIQE